MKSICVFCGSRTGEMPEYTEAAQILGKLMADQEIQLIFGAGKVGLMGVVADAVLGAGGQAIGVIPQFLVDKEVAHRGLNELIIVESMHHRKQIMAERSDAFIILPGGIGTYEEFFEVLTWRHLNLHQKPIGLLNTEGYYTPLKQFLTHTLTQGFLGEDIFELLHFDPQPHTLLESLKKKYTGMNDLKSEQI
jgi:hypothetical protein